MEEEAPARRSVAELAGKFTSKSPPPNPVGNEEVKQVRRRPPRTLQLPPKDEGDEPMKSPGALSPLPAKAKRNSALIEKLQANLALSPSVLLPSPKSPGLRLLPPSFTLPSPSTVSAPVTTETTVTPTTTMTPTTVVNPTGLASEEEAPASFETPPTTAEGLLLPSINKGRARLSIRRRPPSRRHRKSSSGEEVGGPAGEEDMPLCSPDDHRDKTAEEEDKDGQVFDKEVQKEEIETDNSMSPEEEVETRPGLDGSLTNPHKSNSTKPEPVPNSRPEPHSEEVKNERMGDGEALSNKEGSEEMVKEVENGSMGEEERHGSSSAREKQENPSGEREERAEGASGLDGESKADTDGKQGDEDKEMKCQTSDG
ncbi:duboraya [Lampris incognitus]|uniref:duboraya n=1 Tax=Lampris incognitus TaxID=2546036 RepID=UPI0024B562F3|nr:duboraya [Lampris incognitus]